MKKISMMVMALLAAVTMSAETVVVDTLTSTSLGLKDAAQSYTATTQTTSTSGAQYAALGYGKQAYIQIRVSNSNSGVVSTKSAGYIKSVRIIQNSEKEAKTVDIYGSNSALTSPSDLFDSSKSSKVGNVTDFDQTYTFALNYTYIGIRSNSGTVYLDKIIIEWTDTKPGKDPGVWTPDTISVSEARALIDKGDINTHYVKGVVASTPFILSSKNYTVWMTDVDNPSDSLEAYTMRKSKTTSDLYTSLDEMAEDFGLQDTVLIFAEGIAKFKSTYETTSGYYVETLGKSSAKNANAVFKYAVGARQWGRSTTDSTRYKYEIVLSKNSTEDYETALHMIINSKNELGIDGSYTVRNYNADSSYVDGEGPVGGTLALTYTEEAGVYNKYTVKADFTVGGQLYHMDTIFSIAGWDNGYNNQFKLSDDVPFVPQDGDTITCAQAMSYAKSLGTVSSGLTVWVRGYATGFQTISGRSQQSVYMADEASAKEGIFMGYLCYTQNLDSIIKGDQVLVKGNISYYSAKSLAQISKGKIYRIGGSDTKRPRDPQLEARPAGAITVAEALQIGKALTAEVGQTVATTDEYTVVGYIVDVNRQADKDSATWYMADTKGAYGEFEAYRCQVKSLICEDDEVYVTGKISKFQRDASTANIEIAQGHAGFISAASGIKDIVAAIKESDVKKVMVGGQFFIIKNGVIYNAQGAVIR